MTCSLETVTNRTINQTAYTRKRIIGSEQEYGILFDGSSGWDFKDTQLQFKTNGGRLYADCSHPEYASPETSNPFDAVIYDKAGELMVQQQVLGRNVRLFKNNRAVNGVAFGSHENYSMKTTKFQGLIDRIIPFFVSRIIFIGNGFINRGAYELSQRAGVTKTVASNETINDKPIFNMREESHAYEGLMRLHVVSGDANMAEPALFLKYGTMSLVLDLFEDDKLKPFSLENAVETLHAISCDVGFRERYTVNQEEMTAVEIQRVFYDAAEKSYRGRDEMTDDILSRWKFVLDSLEENPMKLNRQIDWVIKKNLIDSYMKRTGKSMNDMSVRNIDIQYHEVNRETGLFYKLQRVGLVDRLVSDEQIEHAVENPPEDTRARIRAFFVKKNLRDKIIEWKAVYYTADKKVMLEKCVRCPVRECAQYESAREKIDISDPFQTYEKLEEEFG